MKPLLTICLLFVCFSSCRKQSSDTLETSEYLAKVKASLQDSLSESDYRNLDFNRVEIIKVDSLNSYVRLGQKAKAINRDFVLLKTDGEGRILSGRSISLEGAIEKDQNRHYGFEGSISLYSLKGMLLLQSSIVKGYIVALHSNHPAFRTTILPVDYLPEVVVCCSYDYEDGAGGFSSWYSLEGLLDGYGSYSSSYYAPLMDNHGGGGSNNPTYSENNNNTPGEVLLTKPMKIDQETYVSHEPIDVARYLKCFSSIPDAGANCSIELLVDIPVDGDPRKLFDWNTESPGHSFIQLKKNNGVQGVVQNIGFYPATNWKTILTPSPVEGKFVDDGGHEYNASIQMQVSPENFQNILTEIVYLARFIKYDIDEYNCTDFALDVFNEVRSHKLEVPLYDIPGGLTAAGTRTPQGVYNKLKTMKDNNDAEASQISMGFLKSFVANSDGPCE